jgi:peptidoglycan biosynthesis/recognition FemAB-like protein
MASEALVSTRPRAARLTEAEAWDASLAQLASPAPIVQSWGWGEAESRLRHRVIRVRLPGGGAATVVAHGIAPFAHCTAFAGPVPATGQAIDELVAWARARRFSRLRISPDAPPDGLDLEARGFQHRPAEDSGHTLVVSLAPDDVLLASFRPKTRASIRRAIQRGVTVERGNEPEVLGRLAAMTAARQRIYLPGAALYRALLDSLTWCRTYVARFDGEPLAAALIGQYDGRAYYLFGGSSDAHRDLQPAHAVQWAAIQDAHANGCTHYDMWGVPPNDDPAHPMHGLWRFKTGFGGQVERRAGVWDIVLSPWREAVSRRERRLRVEARSLRDRMRGRAG